MCLSSRPNYVEIMHEEDETWTSYRLSDSFRYLSPFGSPVTKNSGEGGVSNHGFMCRFGQKWQPPKALKSSKDEIKVNSFCIETPCVLSLCQEQNAEAIPWEDRSSFCGLDGAAAGAPWCLCHQSVEYNLNIFNSKGSIFLYCFGMPNVFLGVIFDAEMGVSNFLNSRREMTTSDAAAGKSLYTTRLNLDL